MKKIIFTLLAMAGIYNNSNAQGFASPAQQWNLPAVLDDYEYRFADTDHVVVDMNGDGKPDLVHTENPATNGVSDVFLNGQQKYWKVYLNNGTGFSATATQWNLPAVLDGYEYRFADTDHVVVDMNGDGKPDLVHTENPATNNTQDPFLNGQQKYWKVYLNTGSGFSATATQWNIPAVSDSYDFRFSDDFHVVADMNGDLKPDFVDTENQATNGESDVFLNGQQKYWKVYLNTGSGFSATATQWNIPAVSDNYDYRFSDYFHVVVDMNGDSKPDFIDTENQATNGESDVFLNGQQKYWKVYLNTGSGFSATATQWNIPAVSDNDDYRFSDDFHVVVDMNGDLKPDFIDTENQATNGESDVFLNGQQKYWKVYLNTGSGFSSTGTQWNIPAVSDNYDYRFSDDFHVVVDMDGDLKPDFIDTENQATNGESDVFLNGQQKYWKVYLNNGSSTVGLEDFTTLANLISIYPNPSNGIFKLELKGELAQDYALEIFNLQGQRVYQASLINFQEIDLSNQANGMYLMKFTDGQSTITKKIIKE
ncbi:T9SS type A sorting domain-containing protein [Flavobacterium suzhouense]|uniref:T9SS type A sorting domain-containing protein n=1 Tax=Flavobacterium suzhouense TaxID=1529638 RepID=A0ABW5NU33_9FLAO